VKLKENSMGTLETYANAKDRSTIIEIAPVVKQQQAWGLKRVAKVGGSGAAAAAHGCLLDTCVQSEGPGKLFNSLISHFRSAE
jgi:hypothetical protein